MHMADALLSPAVGATMWALSAGGAGYGIKKITESDLSEKKLPVMAVSGAFVFAAQMINFTIPGTGSSGHIGGGILLAMLLGEFPALLTIASVLLIQCLLFADGGLLALGANIFNMGIVPCLIVFPFIRMIMKKQITRKKLMFTSIIGPIAGLQIGAFCVVIETLISGITELPFGTFVALMQPIHLAIGLGEGIVTGAVVLFVWQMRPEIIESSIMKEKIKKAVSLKRFVLILAVLTVFIGGGLSLYASSHPDGLEWSMEKTAGTTELENNDKIHSVSALIQEKLSLLPDYDFKSEQGKGTSFSGVVGAGVTCALALGLGGIISLVKRKQKKI
ncbi:MAG: cobalamin biosynthesis protein CbiM [Eubacterium sp.]|nr:cobalamin biosynthesis protein CbiM [Eubacterium sp.]